jgi:hypothetical protein
VIRLVKMRSTTLAHFRRIGVVSCHYYAQKVACNTVVAQSLQSPPLACWETLYSGACSIWRFGKSSRFTVASVVS